MMHDARPDLLLCVCLIGVLMGMMVPVRAVAADQGWLPVVVQTGNVGSTQYPQYQQFEPVPTQLPSQPAPRPVQRTREPPPRVWRSTGPAYMPGMPQGAQVSRPTLTEHGLQMPAMAAGAQARPMPGGYRPPTPAAAQAAPVVVPPAMVQGEPVTDAQERAAVSQTPAAAAAAAPAVAFTEPVGAIPATRTLAQADAARLKVAATGAQPNAVAVAIPDSDLAQRYCVNVADAAADARMAWQKAKMAEAEKALELRIAALEAKTAEYKTWLARRDEFARKANETLVQIYAQMEPEAGAAQLANMDEETAAAVIAKLDAQNASAILNEMQPDKAARLTATIAGAAKIASRQASRPQPVPQPQDPDELPDDPAAQAYRGGGR